MNIKKVVVFLCIAMLPAFANAADTTKAKHHKKHSAHASAQPTTAKAKPKAHAQSTKSKTNSHAGKKSHKKAKHTA